MFFNLFDLIIIFPRDHIVGINFNMAFLSVG